MYVYVSVWFCVCMVIRHHGDIFAAYLQESDDSPMIYVYACDQKTPEKLPGRTSDPLLSSKPRTCHAKGCVRITMMCVKMGQAAEDGKEEEEEGADTTLKDTKSKILTCQCGGQKKDSTVMSKGQ